MQLASYGVRVRVMSLVNSLAAAMKSQEDLPGLPAGNLEFLALLLHVRLKPPGQTGRGAFGLVAKTPAGHFGLQEADKQAGEPSAYLPDL